MSSPNEKKGKQRAPAKNPESQIKQTIALAYDLAAQQIRDGTASSQVITHFLKQGAEATRLENEILQEKAELMRTKTEALKSAQRVEELYAKALNAMHMYSGNQHLIEEEDTEDE